MGAITLLLFLWLVSALLGHWDNHQKCLNDLAESTRSSRAAQDNHRKCLKDLDKSTSLLSNQDLENLKKVGGIIGEAWAGAVRGPRLLDLF